MKLPLERLQRAGLGLVVVACLVVGLKPIVGDIAADDSFQGAVIASVVSPDSFSQVTIPSSLPLLAATPSEVESAPAGPGSQPDLIAVVAPNTNSEETDTSDTLPTTTPAPQSSSVPTPGAQSTSTTEATTTTPAPTTATTSPPVRSNPTSYPGRPASGKIYWGATVGQNTDPAARHETPTGVPLSIRRTFFQWKHRSGYMVDIARSDIAKGRLPWVSIKTPSWQEMAAGSHDAEIDEMLRALDGVKGPVWLTIHHEPEGGGGVNRPDDPAGPAGHLAMNRRVRQRMQALGTDNIALAPILMDWTWESSSGRNPNEWWDGSVYDFIGVDHYVCYSGASSCEHDNLLNGTWNKLRLWAAGRGVDVAVGEWGMRGTDDDAGLRLRAWYDGAAQSRGAGRVVALAAFDSNQNVPSSFELQGSQLNLFHELLEDPRTARLR